MAVFHSSVELHQTLTTHGQIRIFGRPKRGKSCTNQDRRILGWRYILFSSWARGTNSRKPYKHFCPRLRLVPVFRCHFTPSRCIERFSFECRKGTGFALCTPHDWLKKLAPVFHPIRSKTKTNPDSLEHVFPRFFSATCDYFEF